MQWQRAVTKTNGEARKQFLTWLIPTQIRQELSLSDTSECIMTVHLDAYSSGPKLCLLTSGGEIRLPRAIAEELRSRARALATSNIIFDIKSNTASVQTRAIQDALGEAVAEGAFDPTNENDARKRMAASIVRREGQPEFRRRLLRAYDYRCAISRCDCPDALEAAHIRPYKGSHTNSIKNGILLRSDLHTLFDRGRIRIGANYKVCVSDDLLSTVYKEFHNKEIILPADRRHWPEVMVTT